jgi:DUF4097 and DUF4098 domain-containing protein YvlB
MVGVVFLSASFAFSYQEVKELSLPAEGIKKLEIRCGAGFLEVVGREELEEIQVTAEIVVTGTSEEKARKFIRKRAKLSLEKIGEKAVLVSQFRQHHVNLFSFGKKHIDLTVNVPKKMPLQIDDGSGWVRIENIVGNIDLDDGSGSIKIVNIAGNVDLDDGSGEIWIENIVGNVDLDDGSGEIRAEKIEGNMEIDDGSGETEVKDVAGDVWIDDGSGNIDMKGILGSVSIVDGSGSIYVEDVQGGVEVSDGSGSINIDGVERNVTIKRDGSGGVNIRNVKGKVAQ